MNTTIRVLDTLKRKRGLTSDYALAKELRRSPANVSNWRNGRDQMSPDAAAEAAELAGLDPASTVAQIEAERAQTPKAKSLFEQLHDAAELVEMLKRNPALRAAVVKEMREFAQTIENEEERALFLSKAFPACILCQIAPVVRPDICIRQKLARQSRPVLSITKTEL